MQATARIAPQVDTSPLPGAARRFAGAALALAVVPVALEAAALDPGLLVGYRAPIFTAFRLATANALPYLVVAASTGALAVALGARPIAPGRFSWPLVGIAGILAVLAATHTPSFQDALLAGDVRIDGPCARAGGPVSGCLSLEPVPLEDADDLAQVLVPARSAPWDATVRWVGARTEGPVAPGTRVELVAGGTAIDVTEGLKALPPGGAAVFRHVVRLGPDTGRVRLRLSDDPLPPSVFFDARRSLREEGMAIDAGDGDRAWRAEPATGPGALDVPTLRIEGAHADGGHTVVVLSGEAWGQHDLGPLLAGRGAVELEVAGTGAAWAARLVGDGAESASIPLSSAAHTQADGVTRYTLPLDGVSFGALSPRLVVGVALTYEGPPGPFALDVVSARAAVGGAARSGYAVGTLAALDPGSPAAEAMIAVGEPTRDVVAAVRDPLRWAAAILALIGAVGLRALPRALRALPARAPAALAVGPGLAVGLEPLVRALAVPRLEHLPLALGAAAVGAAVAVSASTRREGDAKAVAVATDGRLAPVEAVLGVAALGIVAAHVTADASGQPWVDSPAADRRFPLLLHALASGFEAPLFVLAALYAVADRGGIRPAIRRILPATAFWSVAYLLLRHAKAGAFGYEAAYRRELAEGVTWLHAAVLGGAQYHLYALPLLLVLVAMSPLFSAARRRPVLALSLLATLAGWHALDAWIYAAVQAPEARTWALWGARAIGFAGYGYLAFALHGLGDRARGAVLSLATLVALGSAALVVRSAWGAAEAGAWQDGDGPSWLAARLLPAAVFALFVAADRGWPDRLRELGAMAPGVYLAHPAVLDAFEIAERGKGLSPVATVGINLVGVFAASVAMVAVLARVRPLRWAVGASA